MASARRLRRPIPSRPASCPLTNSGLASTAASGFIRHQLRATAAAESGDHHRQDDDDADLQRRRQCAVLLAAHHQHRQRGADQPGSRRSQCRARRLLDGRHRRNAEPWAVHHLPGDACRGAGRHQCRQLHQHGDRHRHLQQHADHLGALERDVDGDAVAGDHHRQDDDDADLQRRRQCAVLLAAHHQHRQRGADQPGSRRSQRRARRLLRRSPSAER